jgi:hypothetical protein
MDDCDANDALRNSATLKKIKYCAVIQSYLIQKSLGSDGMDVYNLLRDIQRLSDYIKDLSDSLLTGTEERADEGFDVNAERAEVRIKETDTIPVRSPMYSFNDGDVVRNSTTDENKVDNNDNKNSSNDKENKYNDSANDNIKQKKVAIESNKSISVQKGSSNNSTFLLQQQSHQPVPYDRLVNKIMSPTKEAGAFKSRSIGGDPKGLMFDLNMLSPITNFTQNNRKSQLGDAIGANSSAFASSSSAKSNMKIFPDVQADITIGRGRSGSDASVDLSDDQALEMQEEGDISAVFSMLSSIENDDI